MNSNRIFLSIAAVVFTAALMGCGGGGGSRKSGSMPSSPAIYTLAEAEQPAKWTVLVYLDADNDLESAGIHNFNQMESIGSTQDVHVIVQMDRMTGDDPYNDSWTDTRRYLITRDSSSTRMHSLRLDTPALGEQDMGKASTLRSFVTWGMNKFPADHYMLIVWDHGAGWQIRSMNLLPKYKYIAIDDTSGSIMNVTDIPNALSGIKPDIIAFDACYMQEMEVAYELRNSANYMVGSTAVEPSPGYNYSRLLSHISGDTTPAQLCQVIVQQYATEYPNPNDDITQSAIDLSKIDALANATDTFAQTLEASATKWQTALAQARNDSLNYSYAGSETHNLDLLDYSSRCFNVIGSDATIAYTNLTNTLSDAIVASMHNSDMPNANGLAIYVPPPFSYDSRYNELSFAQSTEWNEWLQAQAE